jgi:hypothetical protein
VKLTLDMLGLLDFFDWSANHIHHDKIIGNDGGNTGYVNGRSIFNSSLLTPNSILNELIRRLGNLIVKIAD